MASPVTSVTKHGNEIEIHLPTDPHPAATGYFVLEAPEFLVLFPNDRPLPMPTGWATRRPPADRVETPPDRDAHLRRAFATLAARVTASAWTTSTTPYAALVDCLRLLAGRPGVSEGVRSYLLTHPAVAHSAEMLFTSLAMSARAEWQAIPEPHRGVAARGWFLGRWLPTFLVLDGPILRFLKSRAFQDAGPSPLFRAVRQFFETRDFTLLRHAFAHWSFRWEVEADDSVIVGTSDTRGRSVRVSRPDADAFHIVTVALIEALWDVFLLDRAQWAETL